MKLQAPKLTIILGTYNRLSILKKCLKSFLGKLETDHEIIVIDAGSTDGTIEYLKGLTGKIRSITEGKIGQAKSINKVLKSMKSTYVCWISDDNVLVPQALDNAVRILDEHKNIGMVGLKVKDVTGPYTHQAYIGGISPAGILTVNQGVLPLYLFKQVGYFDETFPDYGIDVDLTTQILLTGKRVVYTKNVAIFHYRDYEKYPGAFALNERKKRLLLAEQIYRKKYPSLCVRYPRSKLLFFRAIVLFRMIVFFPLRFVSVSRPKSLISNTRDWNNILRGQYISLLDLWYNRKNDYYLVQNMRKRYI